MFKTIFRFQFLIFAFIMLNVILSIIFSISSYANRNIVTTKVTDKERITMSSGNNSVSSIYLIYTDAGVFSLEDDLFYLNFNSSDWYGQIKRDSTYTFTTTGYRIGFLSKYPNIVKIQ